MRRREWEPGDAPEVDAHVLVPSGAEDRDAREPTEDEPGDGEKCEDAQQRLKMLHCFAVPVVRGMGRRQDGPGGGRPAFPP